MGAAEADVEEEPELESFPFFNVNGTIHGRVHVEAGWARETEDPDAPPEVVEVVRETEAGLYGAAQDVQLAADWWLSRWDEIYQRQAAVEAQERRSMADEAVKEE